MAVFTAGFEAGNLSFYETQRGWRFVGATTDVVNTVGFTHKTLGGGEGGDYALFLEDGAYSPVFSPDARWLHFWMTPASGDLQVGFERLSLPNSSVDFLQSGHVKIQRGTALILEVGAWNPAVSHWVAIFMEAENSGNCSVYLDGVLAASLSGVDLQNSSENGWDRISFTGVNLNMGIDDIVVTTAAEGQLPEQYIHAKRPNGNDSVGSGAGSTGGAGDYTNVNETPPDSGTSFNEFTSGGSDRFTTESLGFTPTSIHSVTVLNEATREGSIMSAQAICATDTAGGGVTEALGAVTGLASAGYYTGWQSVFNVDPDTGTSWTPAGLADLRIGATFS